MKNHIIASIISCFLISIVFFFFNYKITTIIKFAIVYIIAINSTNFLIEKMKSGKKR